MPPIQEPFSRGGIPPPRPLDREPAAATARRYDDVHAKLGATADARWLRLGPHVVPGAVIVDVERVDAVRRDGDELSLTVGLVRSVEFQPAERRRDKP